MSRELIKVPVHEFRLSTYRASLVDCLHIYIEATILQGSYHPRIYCILAHISALPGCVFVQFQSSSSAKKSCKEKIAFKYFLYNGSSSSWRRRQGPVAGSAAEAFQWHAYLPHDVGIYPPCSTVRVCNIICLTLRIEVIWPCAPSISATMSALLAAFKAWRVLRGGSGNITKPRANGRFQGGCRQ